MSGLWRWLRLAWAWLNVGRPDYQTVRGPSRDRSLRGKDRRRARRLS